MLPAGTESENTVSCLLIIVLLCWYWAKRVTKEREHLIHLVTTDGRFTLLKLPYEAKTDSSALSKHGLRKFGLTPFRLNELRDY